MDSTISIWPNERLLYLTTMLRASAVLRPQSTRFWTHCGHNLIDLAIADQHPPFVGHERCFAAMGSRREKNRYEVLGHFLSAVCSLPLHAVAYAGYTHYLGYRQNAVRHIHILHMPSASTSHPFKPFLRNASINVPVTYCGTSIERMETALSPKVRTTYSRL